MAVPPVNIHLPPQAVRAAQRTQQIASGNREQAAAAQAERTPPPPVAPSSPSPAAVSPSRARPAQVAQAPRQPATTQQPAAESRAAVAGSPFFAMSLMGPALSMSQQQGPNSAAGNQIHNQNQFAITRTILEVGFGVLRSPVDRAAQAITSAASGAVGAAAKPAQMAISLAPAAAAGGLGMLYRPADQAARPIVSAASGAANSAAKSLNSVIAFAPAAAAGGLGPLYRPADQAARPIVLASQGATTTAAKPAQMAISLAPAAAAGGLGMLYRPADQAARPIVLAASGAANTAAKPVAAALSIVGVNLGRLYSPAVKGARAMASAASWATGAAADQTRTQRSLAPSLMGIGLGSVFTPVDSQVRVITGKSPVAEIPQFYKTHPDTIAKGVLIGAGISGGVTLGGILLGGGAGGAAMAISTAARSGVSVSGGTATEFAAATGSQLAEGTALLASTLSPALLSKIIPSFPTDNAFPTFPTDNTFPKGPGPEQEIIVDRTPEIVHQTIGEPSKWEPGAAEIGNTAGISTTTRGAPKNPIGSYERLFGGREIASPEISPSESAWRLGNAELLQGKRAGAGFHLSEAIPSPFPTGPAPGFPDIFPTFPGGPQAIDEDEDLIHKPKPATVPDVTPNIDRVVSEAVKHSFTTQPKTEIIVKSSEIPADTSDFSALGGSLPGSTSNLLAIATGAASAQANTWVHAGVMASAGVNAVALPATSAHISEMSSQANAVSNRFGNPVSNPFEFPDPYEFPNVFALPESNRRNSRKKKRNTRKTDDAAGFSFVEYNPLPTGFYSLPGTLLPKPRATKRRTAKRPAGGKGKRRSQR